jgi:hypothetical protein
MAGQVPVLGSRRVGPSCRSAAGTGLACTFQHELDKVSTHIKAHRLAVGVIASDSHRAGGRGPGLPAAVGAENLIHATRPGDIR